MNLRVYGLLLALVHWFYNVWHVVVHLMWRINGTLAKLEYLVDGSEDNTPAQVLRVVWKNPLVLLATDKTFFTVHERFAPADIVLSDRVHLLSINSTTATFTEVDCDILNVREHPFTFMAQNKHTTKLIILPIKVFYDLVDKLDVSDRKVVWMFNTARCGSTAWVQAFNSLPGWLAFSEPQALVHSIVHGDHGYDSAESFSKTKEYKRLAVAAIKMHLRHAPRNSSVFWKATVYDEYLVDVITEQFPQHKMLIAYRDSLPSCTSFGRSFSNNTSLLYATNVTLNHDPTDEKWWCHIPNTRGWTNGRTRDFCRKVIIEVSPKTSIEWFCFLWAAKASTIRSAIQNGANIKSVKYDQLLKSRRDTVAEVFSYVNIPAENVEIACRALDRDSQAGVAKVSWDTRKNSNSLEWCKDEGVVKRCNSILDAFGLPDLYSPLMLPNGL